MKYITAALFPFVIVAVLVDNLKPVGYEFQLDSFGITTAAYWLTLTVLWVLWRNKKRELEATGEQYLQEVDADESNGLRDKAFAAQGVEGSIDSSLFGYRWLFLVSPLAYAMMVNDFGIGVSIGIYLGVVFAMWILTKITEGFFGG